MFCVVRNALQPETRRVKTSTLDRISGSQTDVTLGKITVKIGISGVLVCLVALWLMNVSSFSLHRFSCRMLAPGILEQREEAEFLLLCNIFRQ